MAISRELAQHAKAQAQTPPEPKFPPFQTAEEFVTGFVAKRPLIKEWDAKPGWLYS